MTEKPILPDTSAAEINGSEADFDAETRRISERRQLLTLGAAGLPMMLTLKASAREVLISQLTCTVKLPQRMRILVDCDGAAWVGTRRIDYVNGKGFEVADIVKFKDKASYVFPAGTVPNNWRPDTCPIEECNNDDDDDDDDDDFDFESASAELDELMRASFSDQADGIVLASTMISRKGDDDDDDDDCDEDYVDSGYAYYQINKNTTISPADHLSGSTWSTQNNNNGLFIELSLAYEASYGNTAGWPGISCIFSIITYLGQQS